ncbi:hypothetical protein Acr_10g0008320 [Actinidia rufa]|uniref:Uncharacterized protein n=1 Tax=Actinidia rufa TaxID=165716 RepID=A0A7J0FC24_9ERIC|nr:hypothetical protein Acr_10g0008320 [Actinidia rufa]
MTQGDLDRLRESYSFPSSIQIRLPEANAWQSLVCTVVLWQAHKFSPSPSTSLGVCSPYIKTQSQTSDGYTSRLGQRRSCLGVSQQCQGMEEEILSWTKLQRLNGILDSLVKGDTFAIKKVLESKSFHRCFRLASKSMASSGRDSGKDIPAGRTTPVAGDEGESHHSRDDPRRAMSKKISLKKLALMAGGSKGASPAIKGVIIGEKCPQDEMPNITPNKKGKMASDAKKKGTMSPLDDKKKATSKYRATSSKGETSAVALKEGTSAYPGVVLGLNASILENPITAKKLLEGVIPPIDEEEVGRMDLDSAILMLFHGVGQVVVLASSLIGRGRVTELKKKEALSPRSQPSRSTSPRMTSKRLLNLHLPSSLASPSSLPLFVKEIKVNP